MKKLLRKLKDQKGQTAIEYALVIIVVIAVMVAIIALGPNNPILLAIQDAFQAVRDDIGNI